MTEVVFFSEGFLRSGATRVAPLSRMTPRELPNFEIVLVMKDHYVWGGGTSTLTHYKG